MGLQRGHRRREDLGWSMGPLQCGGVGRWCGGESEVVEIVEEKEMGDGGQPEVETKGSTNLREHLEIMARQVTNLHYSIDANGLAN